MKVPREENKQEVAKMSFLRTWKMLNVRLWFSAQMAGHGILANPLRPP